MNYVTTQYEITTIAHLASTEQLNPDPIGQRPPVDQGWTTSQQIVDSLINGFSIGELTLRDIREDEEAKGIYGAGVKFLVIDGGHRIRAIRDYIAGRFAWNKLKYNELGEAERARFDKILINVTEYKCTAAEATEIFRRLNISTPVNAMEKIMANDQSQVAKEIRIRTRFYREYGIEPHPLFETVSKNGMPERPVRWAGASINERRVWDRLVAIALIKAAAKGHADAGYPAIEAMVEADQKLSDKTLDILDRFLNDANLVAKSVSREFNPRIYSMFAHLWFELLSLNIEFKISDHKKFAQKFFKSLAHLAGVKSTKYEDDYREFQMDANKFEKEFVKKFIKNAYKNFANIYQQREVAKLFLEDMGDLKGCVVEREKKRSETKNNIQDMLALQDYKCAIDGNPLEIEHAIFGHDTSWAGGGKLDDAAIIRDVHNRNMGTMPLDAYRKYLVSVEGYPVAPEMLESSI